MTDFTIELAEALVQGTNIKEIFRNFNCKSKFHPSERVSGLYFYKN